MFSDCLLAGNWTLLCLTACYTSLTQCYLTPSALIRRNYCCLPSSCNFKAWGGGEHLFCPKMCSWLGRTNTMQWYDSIFLLYIREQELGHDPAPIKINEKTPTELVLHWMFALLPHHSFSLRLLPRTDWNSRETAEAWRRGETQHRDITVSIARCLRVQRQQTQLWLCYSIQPSSEWLWSMAHKALFWWSKSSVESWMARLVSDFRLSLWMMTHWAVISINT